MNEACWLACKGLCVVAVVAWLSGCAGTTSVQQSHPLFATAGSQDGAKVYFIRPAPGFRGVMDKPLAISLDGAEVLALAKGQYTLLLLKPGTAQMTLDFHTVVGPSNTMTPTSATFPLALSPGGAQYLVFDLVPRGPGSGSTFIPRQVPRDRAVEVAKALSPVGAAVREPLQ
jgi:hypothetical protein